MGQKTIGLSKSWRQCSFPDNIFQNKQWVFSLIFSEPSMIYNSPTLISIGHFINSNTAFHQHTKGIGSRPYENPGVLKSLYKMGSIYTYPYRHKSSLEHLQLPTAICKLFLDCIV